MPGEVSYTIRKKHVLVGTERPDNIVSTSMIRHDVASALTRRCFGFVRPLKSQRTETILMFWKTTVSDSRKKYSGEVRIRTLYV